MLFFHTATLSPHGTAPQDINCTCNFQCEDSDGSGSFKLFAVFQSATLAQLKGSVKEPNISIYFFRPSLNGVLFPIFCLLV